VVATVAMQFLVARLPSESCPVRSATCREIMVLWPDARLWLLSLTNFTFGFSAAFVNGKINGHYAKEQLGLYSVGVLMALTCAVAAVSQLPFRLMADRCGKGWVVGLGAVSFFSIPMFTLTLPMENLSWGLVAFYVAQGLGRGAYESSNRAAFATFFPVRQSAGAFANVAMQQAISFSSAFVLMPYIGDAGIATILVILSSLIIPCYVTACYLHK